MSADIGKNLDWVGGDYLSAGYVHFDGNEKALII